MISLSKFIIITRDGEVVLPHNGCWLSRRSIEKRYFGSKKMKAKSNRKIALVTGGTTGIGKALVDLLLLDDYFVHIIAYESDSPDIENVQYHQLDLEKSEPSFSSLDFLSHIDQLVLCAGRTDCKDFFATGDIDIINLNLVSHLKLLRYIRPRLREKSNVLFVSSTCSVSPRRLQPIYSLTKNAINFFFLGIYDELKKFGITATLLIPSTTDTPFWFNTELEMGSSPVSAEHVAKIAMRDIRRGRKYSTPTITAKIQFLLYRLFSTNIIMHIKNLVSKV